MAQTYGFKSPNPSIAGEQFSIGQEVFFEYQKEIHLGKIKNKLSNSVIIEIVKSEIEELLEFTTVIRYTDLLVPETRL
ncbi:hypothetical protein [Enterococcus sp.]|uniref:hypothetical protein n=1 Tax=Enterococcus sp. TaxID=35783 RepID=UPI00290F2F98|nr:hypothetical protein [Enterococcus sp.]MDU5336152.1 hypothetical protein [Enterococcus sp.]